MFFFKFGSFRYLVLLSLRLLQAALEALRALWSNKKLEKLSANPQSCDSILLILTYLIKGEKTIKEKMQIKASDKGACYEMF